MLLPQMNLANRHDIDLTDNNRQPNLICVYDELSEIVLQQLREPLPQAERKHMCDDLQRCVVAMIFREKLQRKCDGTALCSKNESLG